MATFRLIVPPQATARAVRAVGKRVIDRAESIVKSEMARTANDIRSGGFGAMGTASRLRVRSGEGLASIGSKTYRRGPFEVAGVVGVIHGDHPAMSPGARTTVRTYLRTQMKGRGARKLHAFPPGNAGAPIRDHRGVQMWWASDFKGNRGALAAALGLSYVKRGRRGNAIIGRSRGSKAWRLLFILQRASVGVTPIVQREAPDLLARIKHGLSRPTGPLP